MRSFLPPLRLSARTLQMLFLLTTLLLLLCPVVAAVGQSSPISGQPVPSLAQLDTIMQQYMAQYNAPGANLAVSVDGRLVYARGYGYANTSTGEFVQPDSRMRLASNSKPMTATAIYKLIEQGKLTLQTQPFATILNDLQPPAGTTEDPRVQSITIQNLLEHKAGYDDGAGYPPDPVNYYPTNRAAANAYGLTGQQCTPRALISYMLGQPLQHDPGTTYAYSNLGYLTLGYIIERVTGVPYATWLEQNIFPLANMQQTLPAGNLASDKLPYEVAYYGQEGDGPSMVPPVGATVPYEYGGLDLQLELANGGWTSTPMDMLRLNDSLNGQFSTNILANPPSGYTGEIPPLGQGWEYIFYGSLPGTNSLVHLNTTSAVVGSVTYAAIFNSRTAANIEEPESDADNAISAFVKTVKSWPTGDLFPVYATAGTACSFTLASTSASVPLAGTSSGSVAMTDANYCAWAPVSNASWLHVTGTTLFSDSGTITYTADANTGASRTGTLTAGGQTLTVTQAGTATATTLTLSGTRSYNGTSTTLTLTAVLSPYSGGSNTTDGETVSFDISGANGPSTPLGTAKLSGGRATLTTTVQGQTTSFFDAVYAGDANFQASSDQEQIAATSTTASISPASLSFGSVQVGSSSTPQTAVLTNTGTTNLSINSVTATAGFAQTSSCSGVIAPGNTCSFSVTFTPTQTGAATGTLDINDTAGDQIVQLSGSGTAVGAPAITLTGQPASLTYGSPVMLSASATGVSSGATYTWSLLDGTATVTSGVAYTSTFTYTVPMPSAGTHSYTAVLNSSNSATYPNGTSNAVAVTVGKASTASSFAMPAAIPYGTPLGSAQLAATSTTPGTFTYSPAAGTVLPAGTQTLSATLVPTDAADYSGSTASTTLLVNKAPLSVAAANATRPYGAANSGLTGTLTGVVNADSISATYTSAATASTPAGTAVAITPTLVDPNGRLANYTVTSMAGTLTITKAGTSVALTAPGNVLAGTAVPLTATVASSTTGTPTGTVTFTSGSATLGTAQLSGGVATLSVPLPNGTSAITASYAGDPNFTGSTSSPVSVLSGQPDFALTASSPNLTMGPGQTAVVILTATTTGGFSAPISFSCSGLPAHTQCQFVPGTITPTAGLASTTLALSTGSAQASRSGQPVASLLGEMGGIGGSALALLLLPFARRRNPRLPRLLLVLLLGSMGLASLGLTGCGAGAFTTPPGTYQVTINASSSMSHTTVINLTVQ